MKRCAMTCALGCLVVASGCTPDAVDDDVARSSLNRDIARMYARDSEDLAIIRQHSLYPYHFRYGTAHLTELGQRNMDVLASAYRVSGGAVNVQQGPATTALYLLRIAAVLDGFEERGVERHSVTISDGLPGGDGLGSKNAVRFLEDDKSSEGGFDALLQR